MTTETALRDTLSAAISKRQRAIITDNKDLALESAGQIEAVRRMASLLALEVIEHEALAANK